MRCSVRISSMMRSKRRFTASGGTVPIVGCDVVEDVVFTLGLVDRHAQLCLIRPISSTTSRAFVQQRQDFEVDVVDPLAASGKLRRCPHAIPTGAAAA